MSDVVKVLPDHIANQIAAGEVIQRPASVVKELVENSVDAGATQITVDVYDSGKSLIRISDNGNGMSETDARICFERHATSKISNAEDLFSITSFGFRGEALASIVAVAQVEMKTKRSDDKTGTIIEIHGSDFIRQEETMCPNGTIISVRNLFYNIPARRKFLKSDQAELSKITEEFQRVALAYPEVSMILTQNDKSIYHLPKQNLRQRIVAVFGKNYESRIIPVKIDTTVVQIEGFISNPETAKRYSSLNMFFVNKRFFRHPSFFKTIINAYGNLISQDKRPDFFIYFTIPPSAIDVNIHPTKTEIKFENELIIIRYLISCIKESLGKSNMMPSMDFDTISSLELPPRPKDLPIKVPGIEINPDFNPFKNDSGFSARSESFGDKLSKLKGQSFISTEEDFKQAGMDLPASEEKETHIFFQVDNKYIVTNCSQGVIFINQQRAHIRILYEDFLQRESSGKAVVEKLLFPETITVNTSDFPLLQSVLPVLIKMGFDIGEFGKDTFVIHGKPAQIQNYNSETFIRGFLDVFKETGFADDKVNAETVAMALARASCMKEGKILTASEMSYIFKSLFDCAQPSFTPNGKPVFYIYNSSEIDNKLK